MSARRPTQRHRLEHLLLATGAAAAGVVGGRGADLLGSALGRLTYRTLRLRRREVEENLRRAFPAQDQAWVRATAAATYAHLGRELLALLGLASSGREEILARTEALGLYSFREALRRGQGAVVVSGHFGNWEIAAASLTARGIPLDVVVQPLANPLVDRAVRRARERLGMRVIERAHAARQGLAALRAGRVVAFVADQDARRAGVLVPFFGRPASTHRGPAVLALRARAPLFLGYSLRAPGRNYRGLLEEVVVSREGEVDDVVLRLTAAYTARLEQAVRAAPEQYFWHHRRWKTGPAEEPPHGGAGIREA